MLNDQDHMLHYVDDYLHGTLSREDAQTVEQHCQVCRICKVALDEAQERYQAVCSVPPVEAAESVIRGTLARIDAYERGPARIRRFIVRGFLSSSAAAVLILAVLNVYFANLHPSPYDLHVVGQSKWLPGSTAAVLVRVVNHDSGLPLSNVAGDLQLVSERSGQRMQLANFKTDSAGIARPQFHVPEWSDGQYELQITGRPNGSVERISRPVSVHRSWKLMLSSDKPVYQPGQTIRLRAMALRRPDQKPAAVETLSFSIADPKGNVIFKQPAVTSKFGITSADCPLAAEIIQGPYEIRCQIGDTESKLSVDVRPYVLPKFSLRVELDHSFYRPGQMVRGTVDAKYFFGKPVAGAIVEVLAKSSDVGKWAGPNIQSTTDADGQAKFAFRLPDALVGRPQSSGDAEIAINVSVVDSADQQNTSTVSRLVTNHPLRMEVVPEGGEIIVGVANRIYVLATYADGQPAQARLQTNAGQHDLSTDEMGLATFDFIPDEKFNHLWVEATDRDGFTAKREIHLPTRIPNSGDVDNYLVRLDKAVYNGGDTLELTVFGAANDPVFIDLVKGGQTVATHMVPITSGRGALKIDLPAELAGTVQLYAYRLGPASLPICKSRAFFVRPANQLQLKLALDRGEYRPGEQAHLRMTVTDEAGKPQPAAVSLAAVDEAVFAVQSNRPGLESTFFNVEQQLLRPVYEIHDWTPDFGIRQTSPSKQRFEEALFARTWSREDRAAALQAIQADTDFSANELLQVLDRPDLNELKESLPPDIRQRVDQVLSRTALHTMLIDSFAENSVRAEARQKRGLESVQAGWWILGIAFFVIGLALLADWEKSRGVRGISVVQLLVLFLFIGMLFALMLPAVQSAREASNRNTASNNLKQIGLAIMDYEDKRGKDAALPGSADPGPIRVRQWFPETLLWRPEIITDDAGNAVIDFDLADSITTWRLTGSAVSANGDLGGAASTVRVFQPFFVDVNLPVSLTRGDEVAIPVVVYNYLDKPQTVDLELTEADWFKLLGDQKRRVELQPGEVRSESFRVKAEKVGKQKFKVTAKAGEISDAVKREIDIAPDGQLVQQTFNGSLDRSAELIWSIPREAIPDSSRAIVKFYPTTFSQLVEGLDSIFQMPYGCFEQTSSTTYPNVLALDYLRRTRQTVPQIEAKAQQYLHLGYQRLLSFEIPGGGFDWFGNPPANCTLTAYGLSEFVDMARVHEVDPALIKRTREFLLTKQNSDGSWAPESHAMHDDPTRPATSWESARLTTTAYIAAAVFTDHAGRAAALQTRRYLLEHRAESVSDPYVLALVCRALLAIDQHDREIQPYIDRLAALKQSSDDRKLVWWNSIASGRTLFYGSGRSGDVETTALAVLALAESRQHLELASPAMTWLVAQKDSQGTWHSTQATVLALKALLAATGQPLGSDQPRNVQLNLDGATEGISIPAAQSDVMRQVDLSSNLAAGEHRLQMKNVGRASTGYQVVVSYFVPADRAAGAERTASTGDEPLSIDVEYDRRELMQGNILNATARLLNRSAGSLPMVVLDLPIPAGFAIQAADLDKLVAADTIAKFQINPRSSVIYLRAIEPKKPLELHYRLRATMVVKISVPAATIYEYYDPAIHGTGSVATLTVVDAPKH